MRLRIDLSYDGTGFHGWAAQPSLRTVQGELEEALATVLRVPGLTVTCAGRTDAGVHARGQVVHVDVPRHALLRMGNRAEDPDGDRALAPALPAVLRRLNGVLPQDVRIRALAEAPEAFDARFAALWRRYAYRLADSPHAVDPLERGFVVAWPRGLDHEAMGEAATLLVGEHDFAAFCRRREGATTVRSLLELRCERSQHGVLVTHVRADAFCHNMVRALLGCLVAVGEGRRPVSWAREVLDGRMRDPAVTVMPAHGLTLEEVSYPGSDRFASRAVETRRLRAGIDGRTGPVGHG